jgi:hypothetical protein
MFSGATFMPKLANAATADAGSSTGPAAMVKHHRASRRFGVGERGNVGDGQECALAVTPCAGQTSEAPSDPEFVRFSRRVDTAKSPASS